MIDRQFYLDASEKYKEKLKNFEALEQKRINETSDAMIELIKPLITEMVSTTYPGLSDSVQVYYRRTSERFIALNEEKVRECVIARLRHAGFSVEDVREKFCGYLRIKV